MFSQCCLGDRKGIVSANSTGITAKNNRVKRELKAGTVVVLLPRDAVLCPVTVCHLSVCHKSGFCQNS